MTRVLDQSTIRRTLRRVDPQELDLLVGWWAQQRTRPVDGPRAVAVDGKTLRGSRPADGARRHLLSAFDHTHGVVLGQVDVSAKTNEAPMLPVLLADIDIRGAVITAGENPQRMWPVQSSWTRYGGTRGLSDRMRTESDQRQGARMSAHSTPTTLRTLEGYGWPARW